MNVIDIDSVDVLNVVRRPDFAWIVDIWVCLKIEDTTKCVLMENMIIHSQLWVTQFSDKPIYIYHIILRSDA
jgi:hypothetical protein